jgi:hypothetical protein
MNLIRIAKTVRTISRLLSAVRHFVTLTTNRRQHTSETQRARIGEPSRHRIVDYRASLSEITEGEV